MPEDRYEILKYPGHNQDPIVRRVARGLDEAHDWVDHYNDKRTREEVESEVVYKLRLEKSLSPKPKRKKASTPRDKRLNDDRHRRR